MTNFAGTLNGPVLQAQIFALGQWVTYRTRGGAAVQDAFFAPTTKTPYTDDLQWGYAVDLGNNQSFEATFFNRRTRFGATFGWNSGVLTSRTFRASSRNLPIRVTEAEAFTFAGFSQRWIAPNTVGTFENPSYATFDLRAQYRRRVGRLNTEFFVDVFNLFNSQAAIQLNDLVAGLGTVAFGDAVSWVLPRRAFIGARVSF